MRRRFARPFGHSILPARVFSLLLALIVVGMIYSRAKDPATWRWLTNEDHDADPVAAQPMPEAGISSKENIVAGPNESDPDELAKFKTALKVIEDKRPLQPHEMPAYWQLLGWSRTRPFAELERSARRDVPFTQLWEQPDLYRGQPILLRLHVRRVLQFPTTNSPLNVPEVFEAWGFTDDSQSRPYLIVFPDRPAGLKVGTDVDADIVFVGYFLKWMSYRAFDAKKNAPLLLGRVKPFLAASRAKPPGGMSWDAAFLALVTGVVVLGAMTWYGITFLWRPRRSVMATSHAPDVLPDWFSPPVAAGGNLNVQIPICQERPTPNDPIPMPTECSNPVLRDSC